MSLQTEIKNEKALFAELIKKVKQSKTFKYVRRNTKESTTETFYLDKFYIIYNKEGIIIKTNDGKVILNIKTYVPMDIETDEALVEGEALELCEVRQELDDQLKTVLDKRQEEEENKAYQLEKVKRAAARLKASKALRKKQEAEAPLILKALDKIKSL